MLMHCLKMTWYDQKNGVSRLKLSSSACYFCPFSVYSIMTSFPLSPLAWCALMKNNLSHPVTGKNERQKQAGSSLAGGHQRLSDACGWEDQGSVTRMATDNCETLGCLT